MEWLSKIPFEVLLLLFGGLFLSAGFLDLSHLDPKELAVVPLPSANWLLAGIGGVMSAAAISIFALRQGLLPVVALTEVKKAGGGFATCFGRTEVVVHFGRLEEVVASSGTSAKSAVFLPANEFFDDDCLDAPRTACGAYIQARASHARREIRAAISTATAGLGSESVEKEAGVFEPSFGTGACLYVSPPGIAPPLLLVAVATKRAGVGLRADIGNIYECVERTFEVMSDRSLDTAFTPLLGAGKGGVSPEAALMSFLLSLSMVLRRGGQGPSHLHLVVFEPEKGKPEISPRAVRRMLNLAAAMHKGWK